MKRSIQSTAVLIAATLFLGASVSTAAHAQTGTASGVTSTTPNEAGGAPTAHSADQDAKQARTAGSTEPTGKVKNRKKHESKGSNAGSEVQNSGPNANGAKPGTTN